MLGQSCALVSVFSALRRFLPFFNKREGARPLIVTFFCNNVSNLSWNTTEDTLNEVRLMPLALPVFMFPFLIF